MNFNKPNISLVLGYFKWRIIAKLGAFMMTIGWLSDINNIRSIDRSCDYIKDVSAVVIKQCNIFSKLNLSYLFNACQRSPMLVDLSVSMCHSGVNKLQIVVQTLNANNATGDIQTLINKDVNNSLQAVTNNPLTTIKK